MKKLLLICLLGSIGLTNKSYSQVTITYAADSTYQTCLFAPYYAGFYIEAAVSGYATTDMATLYVDFGDGSDTTITDIGNDGTMTWYIVPHTYTTDGVYDVTYIMTMPDLQADTLVHLNEVSLGTCETVSGYVYIDQNSNCVFDGSEIPVQYNLIAEDPLTGNVIGYGSSDASGYYEIYMPAGTNTIITFDSYSNFDNFVCPASGEINTTAPSTGNDFAVIPQIGIIEAADSNNINCFTSSADVGFGIVAETIGYAPSDVPTAYIDFGDGTNATLSAIDFATYYPYAYFNTYHTYASSGVYDVTYIVTMPDMEADTLIVYNEVIVQGCEIISGYVYHDMNTNCAFDGSDVPLTFEVTAVETGSNNYLASAIADASGYYELVVPAGITAEISLSNYFATNIYVCPPTGILSATAPSSGNNFAINSTGFDLTPESWGGFFHPGFTELVSLGAWDYQVLNTPDIQIRVVVNDPQITFVSGIAAGGDAIPDVSGDTLTWDIPASFVNNAFNYSGSALLNMSFTTDVSAPLGSQICLDVIVSPISGDLEQLNNIVNMCFPIANSYDPNYIEVSPHGYTNAGIIDPNLDMLYTIHFQNTGNYPAVNVIIKDTLNGSVLDLSSFEYLASSHTLTNLVTDGNGAMTFMFENIYLPDSTSDEPNSHGWISYRIKQEPDLVPSTTIENTAYIYFDFNSPIITNTALNTIASPANVGEIQASFSALSIYPVPATDLVTVVTNLTEETSYYIVDVNGNILQQGSVLNGDQISVSTLANGIYLFKLEDGSVEKIVIQK